MAECSKCGKEMTYSSQESTAMRDVYRCWVCRVRTSQRSGLAWTLTGARVVLFLTTGIPDLTDLFL